jgi:hypothetical protein
MSKLWLSPLLALGRGALQRFVDGAAEHELAAEDLHRLADRGADDRLAQPPDRAAERRAPAVAAVVRAVEHLAGQQQREGRGVDEGRVAVAELLGPVGTGQLVGGSARRRCARRGCAAAPRPGTSAPRPPPSRGHRRAGRRRARRLVRATWLDQRAGDRLRSRAAAGSAAPARGARRRPAPRRGGSRGGRRAVEGGGTDRHGAFISRRRPAARGNA